MIITITNPRNNLSLNFLGDKEYRAKYGCLSWRERERMALTARDYELLATGLSGLFALPPSVAYMVHGYRQDGSDYQYNDYQNRLITFAFTQYYGMTSTQQTQVFNQAKHMLDVTITTDEGTYIIQGHLNGSVEGGVVEIECPYPYFTTNKRIVRNEVISLNPHNRRLIPVELPQVFFGSPQLKGHITFNALFPTPFIIELSGSFDGITVTAVNTGDIWSYDGSVRDKMIIDTYQELAIADGQNVTQQTKGMFPTLIEGENIFQFDIPEDKQYSDVQVKLEYQEVVGNIE